MRTEAPPPCPPPCTSTAPCSTSYVSHTLRPTTSARGIDTVSPPRREPAFAPGDRTPRSRSFPDRVPGNPRQRQNRWDFFPGVTDRRARGLRNRAAIDEAKSVFDDDMCRLRKLRRRLPRLTTSLPTSTRFASLWNPAAHREKGGSERARQRRVDGADVRGDGRRCGGGFQARRRRR